MKSPLTLVKSLLAVAGLAALSAVSAAPAWAFTFSNIAGGDTPGDAYVNSFGFEVVEQGGLIVFDIYNFGNPEASSMFISKVFLMMIIIITISLIPGLTLITLVR